MFPLPKCIKLDDDAGSVVATVRQAKSHKWQWKGPPWVWRWRVSEVIPRGHSTLKSNGMYRQGLLIGSGKRKNVPTHILHFRIIYYLNFAVKLIMPTKRYWFGLKLF